jgi:hypothetical protein
MNDINGYETGVSVLRNEDIRDSIERSTNRLYALTDAAAQRGDHP